MLIKKAADIPSSEITPKSLYLNRRKFLAGTAVAGAAAVAAGVGLREIASPSSVVQANTKIDGLQKSPFSTTETITPYKDVTNYNNYYEFSTDKYEPAGLAKNFKTRPWTVTIDGARQEKAGARRGHDHQDGRAGRAHLSPSLRGRLVDCGALDRVLAQRIDQARRPSAQSEVCGVHHAFRFAADAGPAQPGAAMALRRRLADGRSHASAGAVVFWHVRRSAAQPGRRAAAHGDSVEVWIQEHQGHRAMRFTDSQPVNTWNISAPSEYGFYSNVNPHVDHPRWSQATERRLGEFRKRPTLMFNGYDQVASLYSGMDLKKNF